MEADTLLQEANKLGQEASKQTGVAFTPIDTLNSQNLDPQTPVAIPTVVEPTTAEAITGSGQAVIDQTAKQLQADRDLQKTQLEQSKGDLTALQNELLGVTESRGTLEKNAGLDEKNLKVSEFTNQLEQSQRAQTNELRALEGSGLTDVQKAARSREINRQYAFEQADLQILLNGAQRNFAAAQANVDRKIQLQLEPLKIKLDFAQKFYDENKDTFDKADDRAFQQLIKNNERKYEEERKKVETLENTKLNLLTSASTQNAPQAVLFAIQRAKTPQEAITAAGQYGGDILDRQIKQAQLDKLEQEINGVMNSGGTVDANKIVDPNINTAEKNNLVLNSVLKNNKIGAGTKTQIANVLGVVNALDDLATQRLDGKFSGFYPLASVTDFLTPAGLKRQETIENESYLDAINLRTQIWASGASLTSEQIKQVNRITPRKGDTDEAIRTKMNALFNFMLTQAKTQLQSEGVDFVPAKVDLFETMQLLETASPEQLQELRNAGLIQ